MDKTGGTGGSSYYLYDGRNSVTGLLAETGALTNSYRYDPYGELAAGTADGVNYYGYRAESANTKTGFQYLRARYYNPENGNFVTEDTYPGEPEYPLTRNRYTYTLNNPVNYADPSGHAVPKLKAGSLGTVMRTAAVGVGLTIAKGLSAFKKNNGAVTAQKINSLNKHIQKTAKKQASSSGTRFQTTIVQRTAEVKARVIRELCSTAAKRAMASAVQAAGMNISAIAMAIPVGVGLSIEKLLEGLFAAGALMQFWELIKSPINDWIKKAVQEVEKKEKTPDSAGKLQREVEKGQAPKDVERVDNGNPATGTKPHVHFKDGTSLNNDGTVHDKKNGNPNPSNKTRKWLKSHGWKVND